MSDPAINKVEPHSQTWKAVWLIYRISATEYNEQNTKNYNALIPSKTVSSEGLPKFQFYKSSVEVDIQRHPTSNSR